MGRLLTIPSNISESSWDVGEQSRLDLGLNGLKESDQHRIVAIGNIGAFDEEKVQCANISTRIIDNARAVFHQIK